MELALEFAAQLLVALAVFWKGSQLSRKLDGVAEALKYDNGELTGNEVYERLTGLEGRYQVTQKTLEGVEARLKTMAGRLSHVRTGDAPVDIRTLIPQIVDQIREAEPPKNTPPAPPNSF